MLAISAPHCFDGERFLPGGATVLVDGRRIVGIERAGYDVPEGWSHQTYEGTLLPGLIDAHVHLVADPEPGGLGRAGTRDGASLDEVIAANLAQQAAHGVTTVRDLGDRDYRTLAFRDHPTPGTPRILAAGPPMTVPQGHCHHLGGAVAGAEEIRAAVAERAEHRVDVVKVMATGGMTTAGTDVNALQFADEELTLAVELAHEAGLPVTTHAHGVMGQWQALLARSDGIEHFTCLTPEGIRCPDDLLEAVANAGVVVCPTLGLDPGRMPPPELVSPGIRELNEKLGLTPVRLMEARTEQMRRAREHDVRIISGVDAGAAPPKWHGMLSNSILHLLPAGYSVAEALVTATSDAADALGLGEVTGRLRPGLDADLIMVEGDLEQRAESLAHPVAVWVRGDSVREPSQ